MDNLEFSRPKLVTEQFDLFGNPLPDPRGGWLKNLPDAYDPQWIVESMILDKGLNILLGAPKVRKSTLRRYLVARALSGTPAFGKFASKRVERIAVFVGESALASESTLQHRVCRTLQVPNYGERLWVEKLPSDFNITDSLHFGELWAHVRGFSPELVVLDPLVNLHQHSENDATAMAEVTRNLLKLAEETALLVIHHTAKPSEMDSSKTVGQMARGSSVIAGSADTSLLLRRRGTSPAGSLHFETRHAAEPEPFQLYYDGTTGLWQPYEEAPSAKSRALAELQKNPNLSGAELRKLVKGRKEDCLEALKEFRAAQQAAQVI